jgi:DNA-directed RNA polymerase specialized sigma24 family protein
MSTHILIQDPSNLSARFSNEDWLGYDGDSEIEDLIEQSLAPELEEEFSVVQKLDFTAIEKYLPRIPIRESDLITLYHRDHMKQEQIAKLFGITQAAVSYRLHRGIRRIQFLRTIPELDRDQFELELGPKFSDQDREILWRMYETTCQSEIAKQMKLTQGRVRHRFFRALSRIKDLIADEARELQVGLQMQAKKQAELQVKRSKNGSANGHANGGINGHLNGHMNGSANGHANGAKLDVDAIQRRIDDCIQNSRYAKYYTVFFAISDKHFNILHEVSLPQFRDRGDAQILPIE